MNFRRQLDGLPQQRISIGEVQSSNSPMVLKTLLGSCVAVGLYDPVCGKGGLNHFSVPGYSSDYNARYGACAIEILLNDLMSMGCCRSRLVAKIFGGANVLSCIQTPVGTHNAEFVSTFLADEKIPVLARRLGGTEALEVYFRTDTGYALLRTLNTKQQPGVANNGRTAILTSGSTTTFSAAQEQTRFQTGGAVCS